MLLLQRQIGIDARTPVDEAAEFRVARDPNDGEALRRRLRLRGRRPRSHLNVFADRAFARPEPPGRTFAQYHNRWRRRLVIRTEVAAVNQRHVKRCEVARLDDVPRWGEVRRAVGWDDAGDRKPAQTDAFKAAGNNGRNR